MGAGFDSFNVAKCSAAFAQRGWELPLREEAPRKGLTEWQTFQPPLTQYHQFPQRGTEACTYIACVCAWLSRALVVIPTELEWSRCIVLGVRAFHAARAADAVHCAGAVAPPTATHHVKRTLLKSMPDLPIEGYGYEETVLLLATPAALGDSDAPMSVGHNTDFEFGKVGLVQYFQPLFSVCEMTAVVVVRPPETYCIVIHADGRAAFRDSHRRTQLDFEDSEAFFTWLENDASVFAGMAACPAEYNCVALHRLINSCPKSGGRQGVSTDAKPWTPSIVKRTDASDSQTNSERCEHLLKENARLVKALQAATAAGFVMPGHISENTRQSKNSHHDEAEWELNCSIPSRRENRVDVKDGNFLLNGRKKLRRMLTQKVCQGTEHAAVLGESMSRLGAPKVFRSL